MKKFYIGLMLQLMVNLVMAQGCLPDGITFSTQEEIDNFQVNYPGCSVIKGDVTIGGYVHTSITNLNGLSMITAIGGDLLIYCDSLLVDLDGLSNLTSIGGGLEIGNNELLSDISGLQNITHIGSNVYIRSSLSLTNLNGLNGVTSLGNNCSIDSNVITELSGLNNLDSVGGYFNIINNDNLNNLTGLDNLSYVGKGLDILDNAILTSLTGEENLDLDSVKSMYITNNPLLAICNIRGICNYIGNPGGSVNIYGNAPGCNTPAEVANACGITDLCLPFGNYYFLNQADIDNFHNNYPSCNVLTGITIIIGGDITNLNGFNQLTGAGTLDIGNTMFGNSPALTNLEGLNNISSISWHLVVHNLPLLTSLAGLEGLASVGRDIQISNNGELTSLSALHNLVNLEGSLDLGYNSKITSLSGLEGLTRIGGYLDIMLCNSLTDLTGLDNLTRIGDYMTICANDSLRVLSGLDNLTYIGGSVSINNCDALLSLAGLNKVDSICGGLEFNDNSSLTSIAELDNLTTIGGNLNIFYNDALTSLRGLDNIQENSINGLIIYWNDNLLMCAVQSICDYLASPNGNVDISGNESGCIDIEDVEAACEVGIEEVAGNGGLRIYPNPADDYVFVESLEVSKGKQLYIQNMSGAQMVEMSYAGFSRWIDVSSLPEGLYILKVIGEKTVQTGKFVKL